MDNCDFISVCSDLTTSSNTLYITIDEVISEVVEIDDAGGKKGVSFQLEKITP